MSIYFRVFLPFALAVITIVLFAWWTATYLLTGALELRLYDQLDHATRVLAEGTFPLTANLLDRIADLQNAEFALLRDDGSVGPNSIEPDQPDLIRLIAESNASNPRVAPPHYALVIVPLPASRSGEYAAIAGLASLHDIEAAGQRTARWLGVAALVATLLMAIVGHGISRSIAVPIRTLSAMAQRIAAGDRDVRTDPAGGPSDLVELTSALNEMTRRLSEYEQEMVSATRLANLGEVAARVAHEIRNPLTAMMLHAQMLEERMGGSQEQEIARQLLAEMRRLDLVVESTLALGRPAQLRLKSADINAVIREVAALMLPQFEHRHIRLEVTAGELAPQRVDGDKLKQVIFNLLTNAADALRDGGTIRITTEGTATGVRLIVEDSGAGFGKRPPEELFQGANSEKPLGFGIGLRIARELVELHQGTISADEGALGGARFVIELPARGDA